MTDFPIGTHVTYEDEDPAKPEVRGVITAPTADELAQAKRCDEYGPDHGDVLVHWTEDPDDPDPWDRSWVPPGHLQVIPS